MTLEDSLNTALNASAWVFNKGYDATKAAAGIIGSGIHRIKHYTDLVTDPILAAGLSAALITKLAYLPYGELPDPTTGNGRLKLTLTSIATVAATIPAIYFTGKYAIQHAWQNIKRQQRFREYPSIANYTKTVVGAALFGILYATQVPTGDSIDDIMDANTSMFEDSETTITEKKDKCQEPNYQSKKKEGTWRLKYATCGPVKGEITSHYGKRFRGSDFHEAIDIGCDIGDPLYAIHSGKITQAKHNDGDSGNWVALEFKDKGKKYTYTHSHMQRIDVKKGEPVTAGSKIGTCGSTGHSTGPHLHLRLKRGGLRGKDENPLEKIQ